MPLFTLDAHGKKFIIDYQADRCEIWAAGNLVAKVSPVPIDFTGEDSPKARQDAVRAWAIAGIESGNGDTLGNGFS